jgi:hypothetical protein
VDKTEQPRVESYLKAFDKTLFKNIKEEIPEEIKNMVFGTLINLVVKNKISLSSPEQLAAEYIFALINIDYFMTNVKCLKHRNNILAKILKKNSWKTPKGFYNYFYLGKNFQEKNKIRENNWEENKSNEIKGFPNTDFTDQIIDTNKHPKLVNLENQMYIITKSISDIEKNLYSDKNFDVINAKYKKIEELEKTLFKLYDEQNKIELEIANEENLVA